MNCTKELTGKKQKDKRELQVQASKAKDKRGCVKVHRRVLQWSRTFLVIQAAPIDCNTGPPVVECTCPSVNQAAGLQGGCRRSKEGGPGEVLQREIQEEKAWLRRALLRCYSFLSGKELRHKQSRKTEQGALPQPQQPIEQLTRKSISKIHPKQQQQATLKSSP